MISVENMRNKTSIVPSGTKAVGSGQWAVSTADCLLPTADFLLSGVIAREERPKQSHPYGMADWGMEFSTDIFVPDGTWEYPSAPQIMI
jgi:hypothetical protein